MILLLGATGYVGQSFARELRRRGLCFIPLSRNALDYSRFELLFDYVRKIRPSFLINAAGFSGRPNVDACETSRMETFQANTLLPQTISRVCLMTNTPWGHVSSGSIYSGAKIFENGEMRVEGNLGSPETRELFESNPERFFGFTELDEPNFSFRKPPCSFLSGAKALAEEALRGASQVFIWRCRMPFNSQDHPSNLLRKLRDYDRIYDHITSLTHLGDFVAACLDLLERRAPFGIYNILNPGVTTTRKIAELIQARLGLGRPLRFWKNDREFYSEGQHALRSSAILDVTKLLNSGVRIRPLNDALEDSLARWEAGSRHGQFAVLDPLPA